MAPNSKIHKLIPFFGLVLLISQISNIFYRTVAFCDRATITEQEDLSLKLLEFLQSCSWEFQLSVLIVMNYCFFAIICVTISIARKNLHNEFFIKVLFKQIWKDSVLNVFIFYIPIMVLAICHELLIKTQKGVILPHILRGSIIFTLLLLTPYHVGFLAILVFYGHLVLLCLSFVLAYLHVTAFRKLINTNFFKGNSYMSEKFIKYYFGNPASSVVKNVQLTVLAGLAHFTLGVQREYERSTLDARIQPAAEQEAAHRAAQGNVMTGEERITFVEAQEARVVGNSPISYPVLSAERELNKALHSVGLGPANKIIADAIKDSND